MLVSCPRALTIRIANYYPENIYPCFHSIPFLNWITISVETESEGEIVLEDKIAIGKANIFVPGMWIERQDVGMKGSSREVHRGK